MKQIKDFFLLLRQLTYMPLPRHIQSDPARLPQAMRFFPLLGLLAGLAIFGVMQLAVVVPRTAAAALLLGVDLLLGGAFLLRDVMAVAGGTTGERSLYEDALFDDVLPNHEAEIEAKTRRFRVRRSGLIWGFLWLCGLYFCYYFFFTLSAFAQRAIILAHVVSRMLQAWMLFHFPEQLPSHLHTAMTRPHFICATILGLAVVLPLSCPPLYVGLVVALLGTFLFANYRVRTYGALDESCYGAGAGWAQILFLLAWLAFYRVF